MNFTPRFMKNEDVRANLKVKIESIENERLQLGIEIDALSSVAKENDQYQAELDQLNVQLARTDARLEAHYEEYDRFN